MTAICPWEGCFGEGTELYCTRLVKCPELVSDSLYQPCKEGWCWEIPGKPTWLWNVPSTKAQSEDLVQEKQGSHYIVSSPLLSVHVCALLPALSRG